MHSGGGGGGDGGDGVMVMLRRRRRRHFTSDHIVASVTCQYNVIPVMSQIHRIPLEWEL
jgi:hypothetical protein